MVGPALICQYPAATPHSQGRGAGSSGTTSRRRQATRNVSATTAAASARRWLYGGHTPQYEAHTARRYPPRDAWHHARRFPSSLGLPLSLLPQDGPRAASSPGPTGIEEIFQHHGMCPDRPLRYRGVGDLGRIQSFSVLPVAFSRSRTQGVGGAQPSAGLAPTGAGIADRWLPNRAYRGRERELET